jgi:hypothetical protein
LVLTRDGLTYAYVNDGTLTGASSFILDEERVKTTGAGLSSPTLHRKVFLLPRVGGFPDLLIGGDGDTNNSTLIYLKNQFETSGQAGYFLASSTASKFFDSYFASNNTTVKPFDIVATPRFLYVLAKNAEVKYASNATEMVILRYELPTLNGAIINLTSPNGSNGADYIAYSLSSKPGDGFLSQMKLANGRLVAYDAACVTLGERCSLNVTAP